MLVLDRRFNVIREDGYFLYMPQDKKGRFIYHHGHNIDPTLVPLGDLVGTSWFYGQPYNLYRDRIRVVNGYFGEWEGDVWYSSYRMATSIEDVVDECVWEFDGKQRVRDGCIFRWIP